MIAIKMIDEEMLRYETYRLDSIMRGDGDFAFTWQIVIAALNRTKKKIEELYD